jgi:hypothetical protein
MFHARRTPGLPSTAERLIVALRRLLGTPRLEQGTDPFDWFLGLKSEGGDPLVVWNLGGAADAVNWPVAVQNALACVGAPDARTAVGLSHDRWRTTPILYVVSDRSSAVLRGLEHRLSGDEETMSRAFGHWSRRFRFGVSGWRQYAFLSAVDAARLAATPEPPTGHRIASASTQATVVGSELTDGPPLLVVYLHVDNGIAWNDILAPTDCRVDILISTCRGTSYRSLEPSAGAAATLWADLTRAPARLLPAIWCCDLEVFTPPRDWDVRLESGKYASPGVAIPPQGPTGGP